MDARSSSPTSARRGRAVSADRPDLTFRVEAAAYHGRPVFFAITGPWTRSRPLRAASRRRASTPLIEWLAEPHHAGPDACRRRARAAQRQAPAGRPRGRVPRRLHPVHHEPDGLGARIDACRPTSASRSTGFFRPSAPACFDAAILWLTYLGLEPYVRRTSPDSLIGWTRLIAGRLERSARRQGRAHRRVRRPADDAALSALLPAAAALRAGRSRSPSCRT